MANAFMGSPDGYAMQRLGGLWRTRAFTRWPQFTCVRRRLQARNSMVSSGNREVTGFTVAYPSRRATSATVGTGCSLNAAAKAGLVGSSRRFLLVAFLAMVAAQRSPQVLCS